VWFSRDGRWLASCDSKGGIKLWEVEFMREVLSLRGHKNGVASVLFSHDGGRLVSAGRDDTVRLWDVRLGQEVRVIKRRASSLLRGLLSWFKSNAGIAHACFSPDDRLIAAACADGTVRLWETTGDGERILTGHEQSVWCVAFAPNGRRLASCSSDGTVRLWDVQSGKEQMTLRGHTGTIRAVAFTGDGFWLATGSADRTVRVWRME